MIEGIPMKVAPILSIYTFLLLLVPSARALNPERDIHQLAHRSWSEKDGYPGRAQALAQTTDGFLWIGTDNGLFRFDGVRFERYVPKSGDRLSDGPVRGLRALKDGSLWIAYRLETKICVLRSGDVKGYDTSDGVTSNPTNIVQDLEGTIWANTETGVIRFNGTRWERIGKNWNFPEDVPHITSDVLFVDSHGILWAGVNNTVLYLKQGSKRFETTGAYAGFSASIGEARDGTIWLSDILSYVRAISTSVSPRSAAIAKCEVETPKGTPPRCLSEDRLVVKVRTAAHLLFDRDGSLWMSTDTSGVVRVPHRALHTQGPLSRTSDVVQTFTSRDGLSADSSTPILEDREGNIWVGTRDGLDQFRDTALVPVVLPTSLYRVAVAPADGGSVWVVGSWAYAGKTHGDYGEVSFVPSGAFKPYRDPSAVNWFLSDALEQWKNGGFRRAATAPSGHGGGGSGSWQVAGDGSGTLWAFSNGQGFFSLEHDHWRPWATPPEVAKQRVVNMFSDSSGRIWVSTYEGDIITMDKGTVVDYPVKPDTPLRYVKAFAEHAPQQIWAGGAGGLVMIDRGRFRPMKPAAMDSLEDITGIVDAGSNGLWLTTVTGVIHASKDEVDRALRDASYRFQWEQFGFFDGLPGQTESIYPYPKAIQGTDGRIWFTATKGLAWIDPKVSPKRNTLPPTVSITSLSADGSPYPRFADMRLPALTSNVQIDYTALSLSVPERVRFRYKLDGADKGWHDAGTRREAYYSNLGPGSYQFRVIACNNDGVWNEAGASLDFAIAPAYFQTRWFLASCAAALMGLLWGLHLFRLRQIARQFSVRLGLRVDERTRLARDLHDSLLQGFQGLMLRFQALYESLPPGEAKEELEQALDRADQVVAEGRKAVHDLRLSTVLSNDLAPAVRAMGDELSGESPATFGLLVEGRVHELHPIVRDEVYRITREALRNAFRHAQARHIEVEIIYDERCFRLRVRDDGAGIPPAILEEGRPGHYGVAGMRERAAGIGAKLDIWSGVGTGTEIELAIAGSIAYGKRSSPSG
ncbi:sensor histidine kinase [Paludibaculum fermentans]|uniref:Histidine kinase/HSP90-like ATPase domain-containing protein n=1 Tax=Paludibaculum fermentans TaxID=1473598 RepID=A0A7S7NTK8_PALFE|nr:sensor histidine kinase [Paludibaculum fermentans]QOY89532.1 hypothetical protein IRI77_06150 [Paludibaculum fermentans]